MPCFSEVRCTGSRAARQSTLRPGKILNYRVTCCGRKKRNGSGSVENCTTKLVKGSCCACNWAFSRQNCRPETRKKRSRKPPICWIEPSQDCAESSGAFSHEPSKSS